ncbi:integrator complex subunit 3 homolog [Labrus bergylta]|uniref:integrator complex subunit 3 homolog n=1 Tax=Labrus bergylta TaxID=56723 RepID=UPI003313D7C2
MTNLFSFVDKRNELNVLLCSCFRGTVTVWLWLQYCLSVLQLIPVSLTSLLHVSVFCAIFSPPYVPPLPLFLCLQPSRRPSLQPTISLDCLSAPSPLHHCHPNQRFASQLSLCLGNPHPPSPCTSSHLPTYSPYSSSLQFPHHFYSIPRPHPLPSQNSANYSYSLSQHNTKLNPESTPHHRSLLHSFYSPPQTSSDSLSNGSCPHQTSPTSYNLNSNPWNLSPLLSHSSPNHSSLPSNMSNVCPHTLQNLQPKSNSNPKTLLSPSFYPGCQTDPSTLLQPDSDLQHWRLAVQTCGKQSLVSPTPLSPTKHVLSEPSACSLSSTNPHPPLPAPCSQRPLKAGAVLLNCTNTFFLQQTLSICECSVCSLR